MLAETEPLKFVALGTVACQAPSGKWRGDTRLSSNAIRGAHLMIQLIQVPVCVAFFYTPSVRLIVIRLIRPIFSSRVRAGRLPMNGVLGNVPAGRRS